MNPAWLRGGGVEVGVIAHGARIAAVRAPDRNGEWSDIALGLPDLDAYRADRSYLGATVGRYANRIAGGTFSLDGVGYRIPLNESGAALHGGTTGFDHADWSMSATDETLTLRHTSPDGDNGFPGTLEVTLTYRVSGSELSIAFAATTDAPTVLNLTNHTYWNLAGAGAVDRHELTLPASHYLPVDADLIPVGELAPVEGTPLDFRVPHPIGARLRDPRLVTTRGYDHTWVPDGSGFRPAARVVDPVSGRTLELHTDQPGVQFYSGNMLDGTLVLRDGVTARQGDAFCLEPQAFPDAPNQPGFPSTVLRPGETYHSGSVFTFGTAA